MEGEAAGGSKEDQIGALATYGEAVGAGGSHLEAALQKRGEGSMDGRMAALGDDNRQDRAFLPRREGGLSLVSFLLFFASFIKKFGLLS